MSDDIRIPVKLFVSKFPTSFLEDDLREVFEKFGEIESLVVLKSKESTRYQGCGFVRFTSVTDAARAIHELNGKHVIDEAIGPLNVEYAAGEAERLNLPPTAEGTSLKLFIGGIPLAVSEDEIRDYFLQYGQVTECHILPTKTGNPAITTKAAFIRFSRKADAMNAIETLDKKIPFPGAERSMDVRIAESKQDKPALGMDDRNFGNFRNQYPPFRQAMMPTPSFPTYQPPPVQPRQPPRTLGSWTEYFAGDGRPYYHNGLTNVTSWDAPVEFRMAGQYASPVPVYQPPQSAVQQANGGNAAADSKGPAGSNLFVFHVPNEWTDNDLFKQFSQFGNLLSFRIARERETNRPKGFGFVSFDNPASASAAINGLNGMVVSTGKRLKVSVKKGEEQGFATPY